jgi:chromosome segregation ATPase
MQNIEDLDRLEKEFEDLLNLVRHNVPYLQGIDALKLKVDDLQQLQKDNQNHVQEVSSLLERMETSYASLSQRVHQLESRSQEQGDQFFQFKQDLIQKLSKTASLHQRQDDLEAKMSGLEPRLIGVMQEEVNNANVESLKQIHNLEIHFGELYRNVRQSSQRMEALFGGFIVVGLISLVGFILAHLYLFSGD